MYFATFILLILASGSLCADNDCSTQRLLCFRLPFPERIPETKEELDNSCRGAIQFGNCIIRNFQECSPEDVEEEKHRFFFQKLMHYIRTTCDPENDIYKVVADNIECMASSMDDIKSACIELRISKARRKVLDSHMNRIGARNESNIDRRIIRCLEGFWKSACSAITVGERCGEESKFALLDILLNVDVQVNHFCTESEIAMIEGFVEAYEGADKEIETEGEETEFGRENLYQLLGRILSLAETTDL